MAGFAFACWFVLGVGYLIKFRNPAVRAAHISRWTAHA